MSSQGTRLWVLAAVIAAVLGFGLTTAIVKTSTAEAAAPDTWDPRVAPLADWVARERGLAFKHPVPIDFLTEEEYTEAATGTGELTDDERQDAERVNQVYRALGLVSGDIDLVEQSQEIAGGGTLAFYDHEAAEIHVLGTEMTVGRRVTVVHELTHVLQDQHFDLSHIDGQESDGAQLAFRALAEGDAHRMERAYVEQLGADEKEAYEDEASSDDGAGGGVGGVPAALRSLFGAPYVLGNQLIGMIDVVQGQAAIDDAFRRPPASDESLIDPFAYIEGDGSTVVATPELGPEETKLDESDFGALTWLLVLGARIDHRVALRAVDGWGGDAYVAFERGDIACARAVFVGDTTADTEEMVDALGQWSAAMPSGATSVTRQGAGVQMEACDAGAGADLSFTPGYSRILAVPEARADVTREFLARGVPQGVAVCVGQQFIDRVSTEELADLEELVGNPGFVDMIGEIVATCSG